MRRLLCALLLLLATPVCSPNNSTAPPAEPRPTGPTLTPLAQRALEVMAALEEDPEHQGQQGAFLEVLEEIYGAEELLTPTPSNRVYQEALARADRYAMEGSGLFLEAVMTASLGPYGQTAEGSEGFKDMLWANLERNPGLTIAVLAEIGPTYRTRLVEQVYTLPPHDYDFARIAEGLRGQWPEEVGEDVQRILTVVAPLSGESGPWDTGQ